MERHIRFDDHCCGCGACADICPKNAVTLTCGRDGYFYPEVDEDACVGCGACVNTCPCFQDVSYPAVTASYIAVSGNRGQYWKSSSGGIFAAMAEAVLKDGGEVYGAAFVSGDGPLMCRHIRVSDTGELPRIQGSKYVRSSTEGVFSEIKGSHEEGKTVLFSGTSCQTAALRLFLGKEYDRLYTVDLVCHGVPEITALQEYIAYLEKKYGISVSGISFRSKDAVAQGKSKDDFILTVCGEDVRTKEEKTIFIPRTLSAYYALFLGRANYRKNCYSCAYASERKPGDITLGDFKPSGDEIEKYGLDKELVYSSVFVRTEKGKELMRYIDGVCEKTETAMDGMLKHHSNMRAPSRITSRGKRCLKIYDLLGYGGLEAFLKMKSFLAR